jgi:hypothetical protein
MGVVMDDGEPATVCDDCGEVHASLACGNCLGEGVLGYHQDDCGCTRCRDYRVAHARKPIQNPKETP